MALDPIARKDKVHIQSADLKMKGCGEEQGERKVFHANVEERERKSIKVTGDLDIV